MHYGEGGDERLMDLDSTNQSLRSTFTNRTEYLLTMLGYTVGLGNIWRWPYQCYSNGGAAFLIAYATVVVLIVQPLFMLEIAVGQHFRSTPVPIWSSVHPLLSGVGWAATLSSWTTAWYYNILCCWGIYYLGASFGASLPFLNGNAGGMDGDGAGLPWAAREDGNGTVVMNATFYFQETVLDQTTNVEHIGGLNWPLVGCLALAWGLVFLILSNGVQSAGKAVYVTALYPYVILAILLVRGLTLPGAEKGLRFLFMPDLDKLGEWRVWVNALVQALYGLGVSTGSLTVFGSFNAKDGDVVADALLLPAVNLATNVLAATVVFTVCGYVAHLNGSDSLEGLELSGCALAFQTYSTALETMSGGAVLAPLFFLMLLALGLDSCFALVELVVATLIDTGLSPFSHPGKQGNWRLSLLVVLCTAVSGLLFVTRGGIYYLNVVDGYGVGPVLIVLALLECGGVAWVFGGKRLWKLCAADMGPQHLAGWRALYWRFCCAVWGRLAPPVLCVIFAAAVYDAVTGDVAKLVCEHSYEHCPPSTGYAVWIGLATSFTCLACLPACALHAYCSPDPQAAVGFRYAIGDIDAAAWADCGPGRASGQRRSSLQRASRRLRKQRREARRADVRACMAAGGESCSGAEDAAGDEQGDGGGSEGEDDDGEWKVWEDMEPIPRRSGHAILR